MRKKNNSFIRFLYFPYLLLFKQSNLWIFGSWKGDKYNDNPKALFEYVNKEKKDIRAVWLTKSDKVHNDLIKKDYECHKFYSFMGIYLSLIARVAVISVSYLDVSPFIYLLPWKLKIIQLWHGTPLKNLNNKYFSMGEVLLMKFFVVFLTRPMDLIFSATSLNKKVYSDLLGVKEEKIKITGQPRNDLLFIEKGSEVKSNTKKQIVILYLPTWREYDNNHDLFFQYGFNIYKMNEFLKKINAKLLIKFHAIESTRNKILGVKKNDERISFVDIDNVYEILSKVDILITDYSSVYFDYLLLDKPIIFTPFDLKEYEEKRGFYYNYEKVTPGPKAKDWNEVIFNISKILEADSYANERNRVNNLFNEFKDNKSSGRVYNEIINIINVR